MKLCPNCKKTLIANDGYGEELKPNADWFCQDCFNAQSYFYVFYDSEVIKCKNKLITEHGVEFECGSMLSNGDRNYCYKHNPFDVKKKEVKVDGTTTDGIPSKTKVLGILPNEL